MDGAAEEKQLFGKSGFAGVRMGDDCEGAPARNLFGEFLCHSSVFLVLEDLDATFQRVAPIRDFDAEGLLDF